MLNKLTGKFFYNSYQSLGRLSAKVFSIMISGAFADFGKKSILVPPTRLTRIERIKIGNNVFIGANFWLQTIPDGDNISPAISIGDNTSIVGFGVISAVRQVIIEDNVLIARNLYISDHTHKFTDNKLPILEQGVEKIKPVLICRGAWIGQNVVVCPGVRIGIGSVIGANSLVNKDVPDYCVAAGSPARIIKSNFAPEKKNI